MIDKAGCKIAEYAGDDNHTWQKQPEALLAHGVEPWSIGLQDHNDGHMPQIDPVLVPGYEVQRTQKPEIHFRQEGEAHKQYTEQDRQDGMGGITGGSSAIKPVTVIIKDPYQDQCGACNRNWKSKLQPVILHTISGLLPESGSSHSQHKIIQRREYLTLVYKIYRVIRNPGIVEIKDDCEPADNSENNGHNRSYEPVFPDCFIKERGDQIKLKDHTHRPQRTIDGTMSHRGKVLRERIVRKDVTKSLIAEHLRGHKDQKDRDTYIILGHNADAALFHKSPPAGETASRLRRRKGKIDPISA